MSAPVRPTFVNRKEIFADGAATRRSEASAMTAPAPATAPWSEAITGCGQRRMFRTRAHVIRVKESRSSADWSRWKVARSRALRKSRDG